MSYILEIDDRLEPQNVKRGSVWIWQPPGLMGLVRYLVEVMSASCAAELKTAATAGRPLDAVKVLNKAWLNCNRNNSQVVSLFNVRSQTRLEFDEGSSPVFLILDEYRSDILASNPNGKLGFLWDGSGRPDSESSARVLRALDNFQAFSRPFLLPLLEQRGRSDGLQTQLTSIKSESIDLVIGSEFWSIPTPRIQNVLREILFSQGPGTIVLFLTPPPKGLPENLGLEGSGTNWVYKPRNINEIDLEY